MLDGLRVFGGPVLLFLPLHLVPPCSLSRCKGKFRTVFRSTEDNRSSTVKPVVFPIRLPFAPSANAYDSPSQEHGGSTTCEVHRQFRCIPGIKFTQSSKVLKTLESTPTIHFAEHGGSTTSGVQQHVVALLSGCSFLWLWGTRIVDVPVATARLLLVQRGSPGYAVHCTTREGHCQCRAIPESWLSQNTVEVPPVVL